MKEILKKIEEFKKGKNKDEIKLIDELINHLLQKVKAVKLSSEFGPKNSTKCPQCGKIRI